MLLFAAYYNFSAENGDFPDFLFILFSKIMQIPASLLNLTFDDAKKDSPLFRANIQRTEDEVEKLAIWLDGICKSLKAYIDEIMRPPCFAFCSFKCFIRL